MGISLQISRSIPFICNGAPFRRSSNPSSPALIVSLDFEACLATKVEVSCYETIVHWSTGEVSIATGDNIRIWGLVEKSTSAFAASILMSTAVPVEPFGSEFLSLTTKNPQGEHIGPLLRSALAYLSGISPKDPSDIVELFKFTGAEFELIQIPDKPKKICKKGLRIAHTQISRKP